jgi:hypothetical protein
MFWFLQALSLDCDVQFGIHLLKEEFTDTPSMSYYHHQDDKSLAGPSSSHVSAASDLARRMDLLSSQRERAMQQSQEDMLDAAKVLRSESERAQVRSDEARAKTRKVRMDLESLMNRKASLAREVRELETRVEETSQQLREQGEPDDAHVTLPPSSSESVTNDVHALLQRAERRASVGSAGPAAAGSEMTNAEYIFLVNRLAVEVDTEESSVTTLRQKHQDGISRLRSTIADVDRLRDEQHRLDVHRRALQEQQLILAASKANPAHRDAANTVETFTALQKEIETREDALRLARVETSTLVSHLLSGADQRSQTLNTLRKNLLQRGGDNDRASSDSHHVHFATELLSENARRRADLSAMIVSCDEERDALRQYTSVLSQRIEDANRRHFEALKRTNGPTYR